MSEETVSDAPINVLEAASGRVAVRPAARGYSLTRHHRQNLLSVQLPSSRPKIGNAGQIVEGARWTLRQVVEGRGRQDDVRAGAQPDTCRGKTSSSPRR